MGDFSFNKFLGIDMKFSSRFSAANKNNNTIILEDAPRPTRIGFIKGILGTFVGEQPRYRPRQEPLETLEVHHAFIALIRDESDPWDYDNENSWGAITNHLKLCTWLEFYDFIELVGDLLQKLELDDPFSEKKSLSKLSIKSECAVAGR